MFPTFDDQREMFLQKGGGVITFTSDDQQTNQYMCYMSEIFLEHHDHNLGFIVKIEAITQDLSKSEVLQVPPGISKPCSF